MSRETRLDENERMNPLVADSLHDAVRGTILPFGSHLVEALNECC
jgi:hypothetical protein